MKQSFQLQAMDVATGQPQLTLQTESSAEFWLTELEPGSTFTLYLYAANAKGLSAPVVLPASTLKEAAKRTVPPSTDKLSGGLLGVAATGAAFGLVFISSVGVVACVRCRKRRRNETSSSLLAPRADAQAKPTSGACTNGDVNLALHEENGGFQQQTHAAAEKPSRLKVPPAFVVNMSDVPESCV